MFKCCLCGKEYQTKELAVKCLNRCGREGVSNGAFKVKDSIYSNGISETSFQDYFDSDNKLEEIKEALSILERRGLSSGEIKTLQKEVALNWNSKTDTERLNDYNRIMMIKNLVNG